MSDGGVENVCLDLILQFADDGLQALARSPDLKAVLKAQFDDKDADL